MATSDISHAIREVFLFVDKIYSDKGTLVNWFGPPSLSVESLQVAIK